MGGIGGALSVMLLLAVDGRVLSNGSTRFRLICIGAGVVGGFVGFRLLRMIADRGEKAVAEVLDKYVNKVEEVVEKAGEATSGAMQYSQGVEMARAARNEIKGDVPVDPNKATYFRGVVNACLALMEKHPGDRSLTVPTCGILAKGLGERKRAVEILVREAGKAEGLQKSVLDIAPMYYNVACYLSLDARPPSGSPVSTTAIAEIIKYLKMAISRNESIRKIAAGDPDLDWLKEISDDVRTLLSSE
jgi:hypothetical protein